MLHFNFDVSTRGFDLEISYFACLSTVDILKWKKNIPCFKKYPGDLYVFIFKLLKGRETILGINICILKSACKTPILFCIGIKTF